MMPSHTSLATQISNLDLSQDSSTLYDFGKIMRQGNVGGKIKMSSDSWPMSRLSFYQDKTEWVYNENIFTLPKEYQVPRAVEPKLPVASMSSQL